MKLKRIASFLLVLIFTLGISVNAFAVTSASGSYEGFYKDSDLYPGSKIFNVYVNVPAAYEGVWPSDPNAKTTDFIKLAVTYALPANEKGDVAPGKFPALIQCCRYDLGPSTKTGRYNSDAQSLYFLQRGYAVLRVDLRGMGASFGIAKGFGTEENGLDLKYIIENWLTKQSWYSGKCAMYGSSNQGVIGNTTAVTNPKTMAGYQVGVASVDYYSQKYCNGVSIANNNAKLVPPYSYNVFPDTDPPRLIFGPIKEYSEWIKNPTAQFVDEDPDGKQAYQAYVIQETYNEMFFSYMTVPNMYRDSVNKSGYAIYKDIVLVDNIDTLVDSGMATYNYAGYADIASSAQLALATVTNGHIVISNGNHGGAMTGGSLPNFNSNADFVRYFDWLLKGVDNGFGETPFAYYYMLDTKGNANGTLPAGQNPAHYTDNLPYKNTEYRSFYFDTNKMIDSTSPYWLTGAQSNNGSLKLSKPDKASSVDYRVDTSINFDITGMSNGPIGTTDLKTSVDKNSITFTTAPLTEKTKYVGIGDFDIWASCENSNDFDLIGLAEVVRADGSSNYLSRGAIRASHRYPSAPSNLWDSVPGLKDYMHSSTKADVEAALAEGISKPTLLKFNMELNAVTLNEGDCIRVTLFGVTKRSGSDTQSYMYYDKDGKLLTGDALPLIKFYTGGEYASKLTLPIYKSVNNTLNGTVTLDDGSYTGPATMYMLEDNYYLQYNGKWKELKKSSDKIKYKVDATGKAYFYNAGFNFRPEGAIIADGLAQLYTGGAAGTYSFPNTFIGYDGFKESVNLRQGCYLGKQDSGVYTWKGIQYAKAPLFQPPERMPDALPGAPVIEAYTHGKSSAGTYSADPDCLNLSVYVNPDWDAAKNGPRSVFMWVFGSANTGGAVGSPDWTNFVKENPGIIVVTPNHRGGRYGSIDLSQLEGYNDPIYKDANGNNIYRFSNNIARLDILEVLKWINENIEAFGGNKNDVAIGGQSSGGNLCASVMMMPESKNLWHKALLQESFPLDGSLMPLDEAKSVAKGVFDALKVKSMSEFLALSPKQVTTNVPTPADFGYKALSPVIDDVVLKSNYFEQLLGPNGLWAGKPILFGSNEGCYDQMYTPGDDNANINTARSRSAGNLGANGWYGYSKGVQGNPDYIPNFADYIVKQYLANDSSRSINYAAKDLDYDMNMRVPSILFAEAASRSTDVYYYQLRFNSSATVDHKRAGHGSENSVIARAWIPNIRGEDTAADRQIVANRISDIWAKFIQTGNPNNADLGGTSWKPYKSGTRDTMVLDKNFYMVNGVRNKDTDLLLPLTREYSQIMYIDGVPASTALGNTPSLRNTAVLPAGLPARATGNVVWSTVDMGTTTGTMIIRATIKDGMVKVVNGTKGTSAGVVTSDYTKDFSVKAVGPSSGSTPITNAPTGGAVVEVNGEKQDVGQLTTQTTGSTTVTTITVDDTKLKNILDNKGSHTTLTLPVSTASDVVNVQLSGLTLKNIALKESSLEIKTGTVTYTLPASQIDIDAISSQFGSQVELKDIKINIRIAESGADTVKIVENTASKGNYQIVVKPIDFEITCTNGAKTVEVSKFNAYVERMLAIPDGIDPSKITTGVVLNSDGTFSHVPTMIVKIGDKYYAKINSLTNSTYSVIWNSRMFSDIVSHWARNEIIDMGSRLIVNGDEKGNYNPDMNITRAEFAAIIVRALGLKPGSGDIGFKDVKSTDWFSGCVKTAYDYGIIKGFEDNTFGPNDQITREQAMSMIARAMKLTKLDPGLSKNETTLILSGFTDGQSVSGYAQDGIAACVKTGIVNGRENKNIAPGDSITRAEVAVIARRLLIKSNLI